MAVTKVGTVWSELDQAIKTDAQGKLKQVTNVGAVIASVDNILGTRQGERVMLPSFASSLHGVLFDPITPVLQRRTAEEIKRVVEMWDDRVEVLGVSFFAYPDRNTIELELTLRIRGYSETFQYNKQVAAPE